jgi:hypothetical protein
VDARSSKLAERGNAIKARLATANQLDAAAAPVIPVVAAEQLFRIPLVKKWDIMSAKDYAEMRRKIGPQPVVANQLGITERTLARRENGHTPITFEISLALKSLCHALVLFP